MNDALRSEALEAVFALVMRIPIRHEPDGRVSLSAEDSRSLEIACYEVTHGRP